MATATKKSANEVSGKEIEQVAKTLNKANKADNPVVRKLQTQVANSYILYTNYKHYHWQTYARLS